MNVKKPVKILYDTDVGGDCDDAETLAMRHRAEGGRHSYLLPKAGCEDVRLVMDDLINGAKEIPQAK